MTRVVIYNCRVFYSIDHWTFNLRTVTEMLQLVLPTLQMTRHIAN